MNKKGISTLLSLFFIFAFVSVIYIFSTVLIYETGKEYFVAETANIGKDIFTNVSPNTQKYNAIDNLQTDYNNFFFPYDLFFLAIWVAFFVMTIKISYSSKKEGIFSFMGYLFIGTLLLLLITSYISQYTTWFMDNIFNPVFADSNVSFPILLYYLDNMALINLIWWGILILINVLDFSFISRTGRVEE